MSTGIPWIDEAVAGANLPKTADREGAALIMSRLLRRPVAPETLRRWPVPYRIVAGVAQYEIDDLTSARKIYEEAPLRQGTRSPRPAPRRRALEPERSNGP
jgi:hypothetical protein